MAPRPPTAQTLSARIVAAAQAWSAVVLAAPLELDPTTEEGAHRLALLDAVHELEYHSATAAVVYAPVLPFPSAFPELGPGAS